MKYLISNALKNGWHQKKYYLFFSVQIFLSFVIMLTFGSVASSLSSDLNEIKKDNTAHSYYFCKQFDVNESSFVETQEVTGQENIDLHFNYEDYCWIKNNYENILSVSLAARHYFTVRLDSGLEAVTALFVTDEYFRNAYEKDESFRFSQQKTVLIPHRSEEMQNFNLSTDDMEFQDFLNSIKKDGYKTEKTESVFNGKTDKIYIMNPTKYERIDEDTALLSDIMIAPIELYDKYIENHAYRQAAMLTVNFYGETDPEVLDQICRHLEEKDPTGQVQYVCTSPLLEFEEYADSQIQLAKVLQTLSAAAMVITGTGFIGLILVIFNNRRKKLAVALVTGATYFNLYLEIILEIETVILTGALLGEITGIALLNILNQQITFFEFSVDTGLAVWLLVIYTGMGIAISLTALYKLFKIQPNEVLRKE